MTKTTLSGWGSASRFDCDRKTHFKRIGLLHAASVFWGHDRRPDSAKGNLYMHGSRLGRAEDAVTGTRPFKGVSSICILVTQIHILSELGPWSAMVGDGLRIRA